MIVPDEGYHVFDFLIFWLWSYLMKVIMYLTFQSFDYDRTWWRLSCIWLSNFWQWSYLMKVIMFLTFQSFDYDRTWWRLSCIWLSNLLTMIVPDEGYPVFDFLIFWLWSYMMKVIMYLTFKSFDNDRTWWRLSCIWLSNLLTMIVPDEGYHVFDFLIFWQWSYLMKVIMYLTF